MAALYFIREFIALVFIRLAAWATADEYLKEDLTETVAILTSVVPEDPVTWSELTDEDEEELLDDDLAGLEGHDFLKVSYSDNCEVPVDIIVARPFSPFVIVDFDGEELFSYPYDLEHQYSGDDSEEHF